MHLLFTLATLMLVAAKRSRSLTFVEHIEAFAGALARRTSVRGSSMRNMEQGQYDAAFAHLKQGLASDTQHIMGPITAAIVCTVRRRQHSANQPCAERARHSPSLSRVGRHGAQLPHGDCARRQGAAPAVGRGCHGRGAHQPRQSAWLPCRPHPCCLPQQSTPTV